MKVEFWKEYFSKKGITMSGHDKEQIQKQAREDERTGNVTSHSDLAAVHRGHGTSGEANKAYQDAFNQEKQKRWTGNKPK